VLTALSSQTLAAGTVGLSADTRRHTSPVLGSSSLSPLRRGRVDEPGSPKAFAKTLRATTSLSAACSTQAFFFFKEQNLKQNFKSKKWATEAVAH
jgi:hypothetical protein